MDSTNDGGPPLIETMTNDSMNITTDRALRVRQIGAQVRDGTYAPPLDGVVESLVMALLPHFRSQR